MSGPPDSVIDTLDRKLSKFDLSWELGPDPDGSDAWAFAVSFYADPNRLAHAERMVASAPVMKSCRVLLGKPPKVWDGTVPLRDGSELSTFAWKCIVVPDHGGVAVLVVRQSDLDVTEDEFEWAATFAIQSQVGELRFMKWIRSVSVISPEMARLAPGMRFQLVDIGLAIPQ